MMLQVKLVHSLGDRLIDLPLKTHEAPLVIGRAPEADVQVPIPSISRRHSLLYAHEGQWYIQDSSGGARTLVNGRPTPEPTPVQSGDVITLGLDPTPPTLTIDPYHLLQAMQPARPAAAPRVEPQVSLPPQRAALYPAPASPAALVARPGLPQPAARRAATPGAALPQPFAPARPHAPPQVAEPALEDPPAEPADDWMAAAAILNADPANKRYYVPKPRGMSAGMISGLVFAGLAIIGIGGYLYYAREKAAEQEYKRAQALEDKKAADAKANAEAAAEAAKKAKKLKLFEMEATNASAAATSANKPKIASVENTAAQDAGRQTEEWRQVEEAHSSFKPVDAIVKFADYMKQYPGTPYAADVRKFTEDALDAIWWEHVNDLAKERKDATAQITAKNRDMAQTQDPEFKKSLQEEKAVLEERLQQAQEKLKEMNYLSEEPPNLFDAALMAALRTARSPAVYDPWKQATEKRIKETRGQKAIW
jgi:hypothetical protein